MNGMSGMAPVDPHDALGWAIVYGGIAVTAFAFISALKSSFFPGERAADHPKRLILEDDR